MNTINHPITFQNLSEMNAWYRTFENKAIEVCREHRVPELWDRTKILIDENTCQIAILSFGSYIAGSDTDKAIKKILKTFEDLF